MAYAGSLLARQAHSLAVEVRLYPSQYPSAAARVVDVQSLSGREAPLRLHCPATDAYSSGGHHVGMLLDGLVGSDVNSAQALQRALAQRYHTAGHSTQPNAAVGEAGNLPQGRAQSPIMAACWECCHGMTHQKTGRASQSMSCIHVVAHWQCDFEQKRHRTLTGP